MEIVRPARPRLDRDADLFAEREKNWQPLLCKKCEASEMQICLQREREIDNRYYVKKCEARLDSEIA